jgi:glutamine amidotransferase
MIAIIQYNAGNVTSVTNALQTLGFNSVITDDIETIKKAEKVIFPGVGEASNAMQFLKNNGLDRVIPTLQQPVLGICLGMQLLCAYTEEGNTRGLAVFDNIVKKFPASDIVPHIGWNSCGAIKGAMGADIPLDTDFYFVHSYYASINDNTAATASYIIPFSAALQKNNFYAVQFHPEKSAQLGLRLLNNFLNL